MRALVTGASGFVGARLARALTEAGAEVRAFGRSSPPPEAGELEHFRGDIREPVELERALRGCDALFHVAARYSYAREERELMWQVNVDGTRHALDCAAWAGVRRIVVTSSSATCGPVPGRATTESDAPPRWELVVPYKRTKLEAERIALEAARSGLDVVVVNPTSIMGAGDRRPTPTGRMVADVVSGRIGAYMPGGVINVVSVADVARGHLLAYERGRSGERYLLGGDDVPLREAFARIARAAARRPPRLPVPFPLAYAAAYAAAVWGRLGGREPELLNFDEVRLARVPMRFASEKARAELGYEWRPAAETLAEAAVWFARRAEPGRGRERRRRTPTSRGAAARTASP